MPVAIAVVNVAESFCRSRFRFQRFGFPVTRRRIRNQRFQKMMRSVGDFVYRAVERFFIRA
jgi:hypothetical protein